jgi:hypothetical protein
VDGGGVFGDTVSERGDEARAGNRDPWFEIGLCFFSDHGMEGVDML